MLTAVSEPPEHQVMKLNIMLSIYPIFGENGLIPSEASASAVPPQNVAAVISLSIQALK